MSISSTRPIPPSSFRALETGMIAKKADSMKRIISNRTMATWLTKTSKKSSTRDWTIIGAR